MRLSEWEARSARGEGLAPETQHFAQGVAWAVGLSAPFWAVLAALLFIWL